MGFLGMGGEGDVHDHLLSTEERIADEFARAQRYGLLTVCHGCVLFKGVRLDKAVLWLWKSYFCRGRNVGVVMQIPKGCESDRLVRLSEHKAVRAVALRFQSGLS